MPNDPQPAPPPDPVVDTSLSLPLLICAALLFLSLGWALYDEVYGQRPWKGYQRRFVKAYTSYLKKLGPRQAAAEKAVRSSEGYRKLEGDLHTAEQAAAPRLRAIQSELDGIRLRLAGIKDPFQDARARIAALTYELDHTGEGGKASVRREIEEVKRGRNFDDLERNFNQWKARESQLMAEQAALLKPVREMRKTLGDYAGDRMAGLNQQQIDGLLRKMDSFTEEIKQIHVEEAGFIDRCESCHLGVREPVALTAADMGGQQVFVSHPEKELLAIHDPTRFGCSPCHNGNGLATSSVQKAHGDYEHWQWPLFAKENAQAGCLDCHFNDRVLDHADVLTRGRDLFQVKGCVGCHRYESFDRETDTLSDVRKEIQNNQSRQKEARLDIDREIKAGDQASANDEAQRHYAKAENLKVSISNMEGIVGELEQKARYLMQDQKKVGPNLKDVRLKLRKEWIPVWLKDPQAFRPGTKMPAFRLTDQEIHGLAAFVWQSGLDGPAPAQQPRGDAAKGKELFETRGCLACHSMGEGDARVGGDFAANLSRLGEKASYDYIVRWVHNPRQRTRPYCPREARDLGPEDYTRHGLPYQFDLDEAICPNDGAQLQVQNMTVMPSLRLSDEDARNIATYLTSLKHDNAAYPSDVSYMDDPKLAAQGRVLVGRYGCASCHEIRGLEDAPRIGTELTKEASKPIEQLDFGLLERQAKSRDWYNHKGFFEHKLANPAVYDQGREKAPEDRLRMPNIQLTKDDIRALTTLLLGSVDAPFRADFRSIPEEFRYIPTDQQRDAQEGWWLVKKYNCMGCHNIQIGQKSVLSGLARYQDPDWKDQLPPSLVEEGARVNPDWLARFLANPPLSETDHQRNGVRTYLKARMPTFSFSPHEIRVLVRFFAGTAGQTSPYITEKVEPLSEHERQLSRALFSSEAAPCLKCHLVGDANHDRFATAPNFLAAHDRLKPAWTARWMLDPQAIAPGTAMPSGLFRRDGDHWAFAGPTPDSFKGYTGDQVQLLVRYMFQLTPDEQRRLVQMIPKTAAASSGAGAR